MLHSLLGELLRWMRGDFRQKPSHASSGAPADGAALAARGEAFFLAGDHDGAQRVFRDLLTREPHHDGALHALGVLAQLRGDARLALELFTQAIQRNPSVAAYHANLGEAYRKLRDLDSAIAAYRKGIELAPDFAPSHLNLGLALQALGRNAEAITEFEYALVLEPRNAQVHVALSIALLSLGYYERGWDEYAWRREMPDDNRGAPRFSKPAWSGETVSGARIVVYAEKGYGDALQFIRYAPLVAQRCARVVLKCHAALEVLFESTCGPRIELCRDGERLPPYDCHASLLDLPRLFGTRVDTVPASVPYLAAPAQRVSAWQKKLEHVHGLRVGIAWAGSGHDTDYGVRSCTLTQFSTLASIAGVAFYALQKGVTIARREWPECATASLFDVTEEIGDFADTAAIVQNLDLVISVDTSVAHLAGSLGKPVWTLLPYSADWRWLTERDDSPWYPTMRLFRQARLGDWDEVLERVAADLRRRVRSTR